MFSCGRENSPHFLSYCWCFTSNFTDGSAVVLQAWGLLRVAHCQISFLFLWQEYHLQDNFLTQPDATQYPTDPTQPDPDRRQFCSSALIISNVDYCSVCMLKSRRICSIKSEHSINIKRSWVFNSSSYLRSRIPIGLAQLLPLCRLLWSDIDDNDIMDSFWKFCYWTQPDPTRGWTRPM